MQHLTGAGREPVASLKEKPARGKLGEEEKKRAKVREEAREEVKMQAEEGEGKGQRPGKRQAGCAAADAKSARKMPLQ